MQDKSFDLAYNHESLGTFIAGHKLSGESLADYSISQYHSWRNLLRLQYLDRTEGC